MQDASLPIASPQGASPEDIEAALDLFQLRHDLAAVSSALRILRAPAGLGRDPDREQRIYTLTDERLRGVLDRLDRHLAGGDGGIRR